MNHDSLNTLSRPIRANVIVPALASEGIRNPCPCATVQAFEASETEANVSDADASELRDPCGLVAVVW